MCNVLPSKGRKRAMQRAHLRRGGVHVCRGSELDPAVVHGLVCERGLCLFTSYNASPFSSV